MNIIPSTTKDPAPNGIKHGKLHASTVAEIGYRLDQIKENIETERDDYGAEAGDECAESWAATVAELETILKGPTHDALSRNFLALEELEMFSDENPAINRDVKKAWLIYSKRQWDTFVAEGGNPSDLVFVSVRLR